MFKESFNLSNSQRLFSRKNIRKFWLSVHLMIALTVGFVFVILGLTGSCNVFYSELGELGLPALPSSSQSQPRSLDDIMQTVKAAHPQRTGGWNVILPGYQGDYIWVNYPKPEETKNELFAPLEILVDPYSGKIVSEYFWGRTLTSLVYELHADFLSGKLGVEIGKAGFKLVCVFGVFLFICCLSGLYLWWPRGGKFKNALTIKPHSSPQRFYFDLHKTTGFYSSALLLIIAFTGFAFNRNYNDDYIKPLIRCFSIVKKDHLKDPEFKSTVMDLSPPISIAQAVAIAEQVFPGAELRGIGTPNGKEGVYMVAKRQAGEANRQRPRSKVWIDQYSGKVLAVQDPGKFTAGETFLNLMWPLHDGEVLGLPGRILWCIAGFAPLVLYITGIIRWLQKRDAGKKKLIYKSGLI
jgi:uncharacterized iron-regulated membrane protein